MSAILGATGITFGDGTIQTTKTPTVISAFTNDSLYATSTYVSTNYATLAQSAGSIGFNTGYGVTIQGLDINGNVIFGGFYNCNCNC
jgi:hypothetical protein